MSRPAGKHRGAAWNRLWEVLLRPGLPNDEQATHDEQATTQASPAAGHVWLEPLTDRVDGDRVRSER
jgi:hypothetical protein